MLLIGLTGGIVSGKSVVSDRFAELGVPIVDADLLAREAVAPGSEGLAGIVDRFGSSMLKADGMLDREALRSVVFAEPAEREALDGLLHPIIRASGDQRIEQARRSGAPYAIHAVPLLVETGQVERFDRILVVDVPEVVQLARIVDRDGGDERAARQILAAQASRDERLAVADDVIVNTGTVAQAQGEVDALDARYRTLAEGPA